MKVLARIALLSKLPTSMPHELNTPLRIAITANSNIENLIDDLSNNIETQSITKQDLLDFIHFCQDSRLLSRENLQSLATFIYRFKHFMQAIVKPISRIFL